MEENMIQINGQIMINVDVFEKDRHASEKDYVWNPYTCICENGKYSASIMDDSLITCDEIIASYNEETNFYEKKTTCKMQNFYILHAFLLVTIGFLLVVGIYCYLIKCKAKQQHLLPFQFTNTKLKEIIY